ncbi:hypothetical protein K458DRAFT_408221 [Lentithecium fluviatile CBS 122367]|uniref:Uncharacterized protein n=1 Tax=Lentithecium fluviatile CBS 122367 TaxID=1168545 RepID=A0A6G1IM97_9PLEO|nr:hypothetical protein K458DRAFT_408221 [Lentithecium fluviatile CBS 122367]
MAFNMAAPTYHDLSGFICTHLYHLSQRKPQIISIMSRQYRHPGTRFHSAQELRKIEDRVETVVNLIDRNAGNIVPLIAKDLSSLAAQKELRLLPVFDDLKAEKQIPDESKFMIHQKMVRYHRQHAHNLALKKEVDIVITWDCPEVLTEAHIRFVDKWETLTMKQAYACNYKGLDWDRNHADELERDDPKRPSPGECRRPVREDKSVPLEPPARKGGYYACVPVDLYQKLLNLSPSWGAEVKLIVAPKKMAPEEAQEMAEYDKARRSIEENILAQEAREWEEIERKGRRVLYEEGHHPRSAYSRFALAERDRLNLLNAHVDQGGGRRSG